MAKWSEFDLTQMKTLRLNQKQYQEFLALIELETIDWPLELTIFIKQQEGGWTGDALFEHVATWIKKQKKKK